MTLKDAIVRLLSTESGYDELTVAQVYNYTKECVRSTEMILTLARALNTTPVSLCNICEDGRV